MPLRVSGRNISIGAALQQKITERVEEAASKQPAAGIQAMPRSARTALVSEQNVFCILIPVHCSRLKGWHPIPMTARNRQRFG